MEQNPLINYTKEAFTLPLNLAYLMILVTAVIGGTIFLGEMQTPFLLIAALGAAAEMAYLAMMPSNLRFIRAVNSKYHQVLTQEERKHQSFRYLQQMGKIYLDRYMVFFNKKQTATENLLRSGNKSNALDYTYIEKLDSLESYYVELLYGLEQYEKYAQSGSKEQLESDINKIKAEIAQNTSEKVKQQYLKRIDVLKKRLEKLAVATENMQVARIQMDTLDDTINFVVEQSLSLKNPDEISRAIDSVISSAEEHQTTIEELDRMLSEINSLSLPQETKVSDTDYSNPLQQSQSPLL